MAELDALVESLKAQSTLLIASSSMAATGSPDPRDAFVRPQLKRAAELVSGAAALGAARNPACLGILSRSLLEQLITVSWGIRAVENAESQTSSGVAEMAKALRINLQAGTARIRDRQTGKDVTADYLANEQMKQSRRRKSVEEQAKEAGIQDLYTVFYRMLSLETHGHHEILEDASEIATLCATHLHGIGAISRAIGQACVWWLMHRHWPDNELLRDVLGLNATG